MRSLPGRWSLLLALMAPPLQAQGPSPEVVARELDSFIRQGMADWQIPGLSVVVVRHDSILFQRGYGVRSLNDGGLVDSETLFGMMSTTKAMTALSLAMLVDEGRISWSDPLSRWMPEVELPDPWVTREITVKDLLTHNTGLANADLLWVRGDLSDQEIFRRLRFVPRDYSFRGGFGYQNVMYGLAGEVIARVSGMSYAEFLRRRIVQPLGLRRTYPSYGAMRRAHPANVSRPHDRIGGALRVIGEDSVDVLPAAGSVWSTASDMGRWVRFLLDSGRVNGVRLVSDSGYRMLFQPQVIITPEEFYPTAELTHPHWMTYGLGWFQQDYAGRYLAFHTGSLDGRTAIVGLMPEEGIGLYAFGNLDHAEFRHALMLQTLDLLLDRPGRDWSTELRQLYARLAAKREAARVDREQNRVLGTSPSLPLAAYRGGYVHPAWGTLEVDTAGGGLVARLGTNALLHGTLSHWSHDTFAVTWGDGRGPPNLLQFVIGPDGSVAEVRLDLVGDAAFTRQ